MFIEFMIWMIVCALLYAVSREMTELIGKWSRIGMATAIIVAVIVIGETALYYGTTR